MEYTTTQQQHRRRGEGGGGGSLRDALRALTAAAAASSSSGVIVESISTLPSLTSTAATSSATSSSRHEPRTLRTSHRAAPTSMPRTAPPSVLHPHASAAAVADSDDALLLLHAARLTSMSRRSLVGADSPASSLHAFASSTPLTTDDEPIVRSIDDAAHDDAAGEVVASDERSTTEDEEGALQPTVALRTLGGRDPTHPHAHERSTRKRVKLSRDSQEPHHQHAHHQHHRASRVRRRHGRSRTPRPIHNATNVMSSVIGSSEEEDDQPSHASSAMDLYRHRAAVLQLLRRGRSRSLIGLVRRSRIKRRVMQRVIEHMVSDDTLQETAMTLHASGDGRTVRGSVVGRRRIFYSIIDSNAHNNDRVGRWQVRRSNSKSTRTWQTSASAIRTAAVTGLPSAPVAPPANVDVSSCGVKRPRCHLQLLGSDSSSSDDPSSCR
jgi:hypothetical protein